MVRFSTDLFGTPVLPGFDSGNDMISVADESALIDRINRQHLRPFRFQGWEGKRPTTSFGWSYDF